MARVRLDSLLAQRGLAESRQKAQALVMAGVVTVDGTRAQKSGQLVRSDAALVVEKRQPYVSRGGYKLAYALDHFGISVDGLTALDVGASTGGFTDVLLQRGARRVYAVDVGYGQLDVRLRADARVVVLERTNIRHLERLPDEPNVATVDVSFISLRLVIPALRRLLKSDSSMIVLVKPQFEAGRAEVSRGGVVRSAATHRRVLEQLAAWLMVEELTVRGITASPIRGPAGNVEFLAWLSLVTTEQVPIGGLIEGALAEAHGADWKAPRL